MSELEPGLEPALRSIAVDLAHRAGEALASRSPGSMQAKSSPTDMVTDADRAAEKLIFQTLMQLRPGDTIVSEEGSVNQGDSGVEWVIDPLDGTINYIYGIPQWCVSIGVEGSVRLGVVHDPNRQETFCDPESLVPSTNTELADSLIGTGFSYSADVRAEQAAVLQRVMPLVRDIRRAGSCALDLAWVACGRLDGFYERGVHRWDTSAGIALIEAAGGCVRVHGDLTLAAGTAQLLEKLEAVVTNADG